jgi:hypothetical protein
MSELSTSLTSLREEDGLPNASRIACDNGNELEWISGYCSTKPHSTTSVDTEIGRWAQVGEQMLDLVKLLAITTPPTTPLRQIMPPAVLTVHPLFAYCSGA